MIGGLGIVVDGDNDDDNDTWWEEELFMCCCNCCCRNSEAEVVDGRTVAGRTVAGPPGDSRPLEAVLPPEAVGDEVDDDVGGGTVVPEFDPTGL